MKRFDLGAGVGRSLTAFGSRGVSFAPVLRPGVSSVVRMLVEPGGVLGLHPAREHQLFIVVEGAGWVRTDSGPRVEIGAGQAAFWGPGEVHESGSDTGMTAIVVEGPDLAPELPELG